MARDRELLLVALAGLTGLYAAFLVTTGTLALPALVAGAGVIPFLPRPAFGYEIY